MSYTEMQTSTVISLCERKIVSIIKRRKEFIISNGVYHRIELMKDKFFGLIKGKSLDKANKIIVDNMVEHLPKHLVKEEVINEFLECSTPKHLYTEHPKILYGKQLDEVFELYSLAKKTTSDTMFISTDDYSNLDWGI